MRARTRTRHTDTKHPDLDPECECTSWALPRRVINLSLIACEIRDRRSICPHLCIFSWSRCLGILLFVFVILVLGRGSSSLLLYYVEFAAIHAGRPAVSHNLNYAPPYWVSYCNFFVSEMHLKNWQPGSQSFGLLLT